MNAMENEERSKVQEAYRQDPTALTTSQLLREILGLKELMIGRIGSVEKGIATAHDDLVRFPTEVQKQVASLREFLLAKVEDSDKLKEEKFKNIDKRLDLVEQARIEQKKDTATAVDAALKAAKEAVTEQNTSNGVAINKSEAAIMKLIDQQAVLISQIKDTFDDKITDIKTALAGTKGKGEGIDKIVYIIIALAGVLYAIFKG